jgi:peroxiredoxin
MRKLSSSLFVVAAVMMFATAALFVARSSAEENAPQQTATVGQPAPQFSLEDQDGKVVNLSDFAGKVVVLEWFNNKCPFVQKFYKNRTMNELAKKYTDQDVVWLAINSGKDATNESNAAAAKEWEMERPILNDSTQETAKAYGATNTPHMYVIDKQGNIAYMGAIDSKVSTKTADIEGAENYVSKALDEVLAGTNVTKPETKAYGCTIFKPQ